MIEFIVRQDGEYTGEQVVRCRDCEHFNPRDAGCMYWVMAENRILHVNNPYGYCAWGKRRADA